MSRKHGCVSLHVLSGGEAAPALPALPWLDLVPSFGWGGGGLGERARMAMAKAPEARKTPRSRNDSGTPAAAKTACKKSN